MIPKTVHFFSVAITAFIPWLLSISALGAIMDFPRLPSVLFYYTLIVLLFGIAFAIYFHGHKNEDPFTVMSIALGCSFAYEIIYVVFLYEGERWFLTYVDYFVPLFLIASTIYWSGIFFGRE